MKKQAKTFDTKKSLIVVILALLTILVMIHIGFSVYFKNHFVFGTYINGIDFSGKTVKEVEDSITSKVRKYVLTLEEKEGKKEYISASDINMKTVLDTNLQEIKDKQKSYHWVGSLFNKKNYDIATMVTYDKEQLKQTFEDLKCFDKVVVPKDAYISEYTEDEGYVIVDEVEGNQVNKDKLYDLVVNSVDDLKTSISIEKEGCYNKPKYTSDSKQLKEALKILNKYVETNITYEFGDRKETVDASVISEWLEVDDKFNVVFNTDSVKKYVDYLGYTYNTFGATRTFKTSYNKSIKVKGGDYGWWLNRGLEVEELIDAVKKGDNIKKVPNYYQKAGSYGENDIGNTYVEINLKAQHMFYYKDGELVIESDIVSGNLARGHGTPVGTYSITYKERDATLEGEDYSTPVKYWMPFNNNIGLHDASWRYKFGGELYLTQGSHGCINLPPNVAKTIFESIEKGTAVVVYKLEVNSNKTDDESSNKEDKSKKVNSDNTNSQLNRSGSDQDE